MYKQICDLVRNEIVLETRSSVASEEVLAPNRETNVFQTPEPHVRQWSLNACIQLPAIFLFGIFFVSDFIATS